jgi:predicted O-methyltransferase YrrM
MINNLIEKAGDSYAAEIKAALPSIEDKIIDLRKAGRDKYPELPTYSNDLIHGTINTFDAEVLYFLIRKFKPKVVFEIGTWIGTSAMVMAEAIQKNNNGGKIYTCDINNYFLLGDTYKDIITPINEFSDIALNTIPLNQKIDLVFTDGELTFGTLKELSLRLNSEALLVTHDFIPPAEKGVLNYVRTQIVSKFKYNLVANNKKNTDYEKGSSIAILIKNYSVEILHLQKQSFIKKILTTFQFAISAFIVKTTKKLFK